MRPRPPERPTHDYRRHGTTSLFAALNVAIGKVLTQCHRRYHAVEYVKFLHAIDKAVPADEDIHVVLDNYGTHKSAMIHEWLARHPCFHLHFTPTSASWLNLGRALVRAAHREADPPGHRPKPGGVGAGNHRLPRDPQ